MRIVEMIRLNVKGSFRKMIPQEMLTTGISRIKLEIDFIPICLIAIFHK